MPNQRINRNIFRSGGQIWVPVIRPTMGPDIIVNGTFAADVNWLKGVGWTIPGGKATHTGGLTLITNTDALTVVPGRWYKFNFDCTVNASTPPNCNPFVGSNDAPGIGTISGSFVSDGYANGNNKPGFYSAGEVDVTNVKCFPMTFPTCIHKLGTGSVYSSVWAKMIGSVNGTKMGVAILDSPSNPRYGVLAYRIFGSQMQMYSLSAGSITYVYQNTTAYVPGAKIELRHTALTTYQLWYNGVQMGVDQTIVDATINALNSYYQFSTDSSGLFSNAGIVPL